MYETTVFVFQDCQIKYRMQIKFEFQTYDFSMVCSIRDMLIVFVVYMKFKFNYLAYIFIC